MYTRVNNLGDQKEEKMIVSNRMMVHNNRQGAVRQQPPAFTATPDEITTAVDRAGFCTGKKALLYHIAGFFRTLQTKMPGIEDAPDNYTYNLGQRNEVPEPLQGVVVINNLTLEDMDEKLNHNPFACTPASTCVCGAGMSQGELAKSLITELNVPNPDIITISK